jgi:hypothetical protein
VGGNREPRRWRSGAGATGPLDPPHHPSQSGCRNRGDADHGSVAVHHNTRAIDTPSSDPMNCRTRPESSSVPSHRSPTPLLKPVTTQANRINTQPMPASHRIRSVTDRCRNGPHQFHHPCERHLLPQLQHPRTCAARLAASGCPSAPSGSSEPSAGRGRRGHVEAMVGQGHDHRGAESVTPPRPHPTVGRVVVVAVSDWASPCVKTTSCFEWCLRGSSFGFAELLIRPFSDLVRAA